MYIILYYIILYCIVLYCIVLYCIVLYCIVLYYIILYYNVKPPVFITQRDIFHYYIHSLSMISFYVDMICDNPSYIIVLYVPINMTYSSLDGSYLEYSFSNWYCQYFMYYCTIWYWISRYIHYWMDTLYTIEWRSERTIVPSGSVYRT